MITKRFVGATLLVAGTTIGAGMLAVPVTTGVAGYYPSLAIFGVTWLFMLFTAYLFLEVNLWLNGDPNLITMARVTIGKTGAMLTWCLYLLLLYSLTAAYIAGCGSMMLDTADKIFHIKLPEWFEPIPMLCIFGVFIYLGTKAVDWLNRLLMIGLFISFAALISITFPQIKQSLLSVSNSQYLGLGISVVITSFGFHIVIPSLTHYLKRDANQLRWSVFIGSLIPMIIYILWQTVILGIVPINGPVSLSNSFQLGEAATQPLAKILHNSWIAPLAQLFSFFAIVTSFIGVSLSLSHCLHDGLKIPKKVAGKALIWLLTFIPPVIFVLYYPKGFILALQYAGIWVCLLLGLLPIVMVWRGRYTYRFPNENRTIGGKPLLVLAALFFVSLVVLEICGQYALLPTPFNL